MSHEAAPPDRQPPLQLRKGRSSAHAHVREQPRPPDRRPPYLCATYLRTEVTRTTPSAGRLPPRRCSFGKGRTGAQVPWPERARRYTPHASTFRLPASTI